MAARRCLRRPRLYYFQPPSRQISCCPQACFFMVASGFCRTRHHIRIPAGRRGKGCGLVPTASVPFYRKAHKLSQKPLRHVKFHWPRWATWSRLAEREAGKPRGGLPRLPQVRRPGRRGPNQVGCAGQTGLCIMLLCVSGVPSSKKKNHPRPPSSPNSISFRTGALKSRELISYEIGTQRGLGCPAVSTDAK